MGAERAKIIHAWSLDNHDRMAAAVERYEIDCAYRLKSADLFGVREISARWDFAFHISISRRTVFGAKLPSCPPEAI